MFRKDRATQKETIASGKMKSPLKRSKQLIEILFESNQGRKTDRSWMRGPKGNIPAKNKLLQIVQ